MEIIQQIIFILFYILFKIIIHVYIFFLMFFFLSIEQFICLCTIILRYIIFNIVI